MKKPGLPMRQIPRRERSGLPYGFASARVWRVRDASGIVHRTCAVFEETPQMRTRTICERTHWWDVEPVSMVEGAPMVTCLECLGSRYA
jgi:hypothetical protein